MFVLKEPGKSVECPHVPSAWLPFSPLNTTTQRTGWGLLEKEGAVLACHIQSIGVTLWLRACGLHTDF